MCQNAIALRAQQYWVLSFIIPSEPSAGKLRQISPFPLPKLFHLASVDWSGDISPEYCVAFTFYVHFIRQMSNLLITRKSPHF